MRAPSVAMADAPPLPPTFPAGVATSRARRSYIREPDVDFSNAEVAERVARMHEQRAADIRAGLITRGSPSILRSKSSSEAIRGPGRRVVTPRSQPRVESAVEEESEEDESEASPAQGSRGAQVQRTAGGGTHTRFSS